MDNYIVINGQRIELTEDQVKLITANEESDKRERRFPHRRGNRLMQSCRGRS